MSRSFSATTKTYEDWLRKQTYVIEKDLVLKHRLLKSNSFTFLRGSFYRWAERFPILFPELANSVQILGVGDIHLENYGTWHDIFGRVVWGINDYDEAAILPFTQDLVRLSTSAVLAIHNQKIKLPANVAVSHILDMYRRRIKEGVIKPYVLESNPSLASLMRSVMPDEERFWEHLQSLPLTTPSYLKEVGLDALLTSLPKNVTPQFRTRVAGIGSLGKPRLLAMGLWRGGWVAFEGKPVVPSAWAPDKKAYAERRLVKISGGNPDPLLAITRNTLLRPLSPQRIRLELANLPRTHDELNLLGCMGGELANIHLSSPARKEILSTLKKLPHNWLYESALKARGDVEKDFKSYKS